MQITLEPTGRTFVTDSKMPVREWIGRTAAGTPITALIYALAPRGDRTVDLAAELKTLHELAC
jgi:hypothetical protein